MITAATRRPGRPEVMGPWQEAPLGLIWRHVALDTRLADETYLLAEDELDRAGRFCFELDRRRYVAGRAALRLSLAEVLGLAPDDISFSYGEQGKPSLSNKDCWRFNLSHSGNVGLIVIGSANVVDEVGIDVELFRPVDDWRMLAEANFSPQECRQLEGVPEEQRSRAFLSCWTRKEACVKALGTGLSLPTSGFTVGFEGERFAVSIDCGVELRDVRGADVVIGNDCVAALAWCRSTQRERLTPPKGNA